MQNNNPIGQILGLISTRFATRNQFCKRLWESSSRSDDWGGGGGGSDNNCIIIINPLFNHVNPIEVENLFFERDQDKTGSDIRTKYKKTS